MKKSDNTRSHSWWWDSHISPKNSKWLQENLSEMDSKVSAMLKIIEEDADSFAQRAEMFYKKRPELINLVEEFYRTYRALVERYTYLTREIRQNIAPALQAQLGVSSESAQNSPVDLHLKRGIDGPDIISPSYSYTGASEFDYDSPVSAKGHTDDEFSPLGIRANYEARAFGFKPRFPSLEESSHKATESGCLHGGADVDISQLQRELLRLQDENKALANKSTEDITKLKSLQLELSGLQSRVRSLEAEEKVTKKRLTSVQEKEQRLEAENLKLSHALISSKEERTELLDQHHKLAEDSKIACQKNQLLEDQMVVLKQELLTAQSKVVERDEHFRSSKEAFQKLEQALATLEEERLKDSFLMEIYEQQSQDLHNKVSDFEKKNASLTEETLAQAVEVRKLQDHLTEVMNDTKVLEQLLADSKQEMKVSELEKYAAIFKVEELQKELEGVQRDRQGLSDQVLQQAGDIAWLRETICKLEEEGQRAQMEKMEGSKYVHKLESDIKEGQRATQTLVASCQQYENRCKFLEVDVAQLKEKLSSSSGEITHFQNQLKTFESIVATAELRKEELQQNVSSLVVERTSLMDKLETVSEQVKIAEGQTAQMHEIINDKQEEIKMLKHELVNQLAETKRLEESISHVSKEKIALLERETEILRIHKQSENEHIQLKQQLELNFTLIKDLKDKISSLEIAESELVLKSQQTQQKVVDLRNENSVLSSHCSRSIAGLQAAEGSARKAEEDLALAVLEVAKLQADGRAKGELLHKLMSNVESLETQLARSKEENSLLGEDIEKFTKNLANFEAQNSDLKTRLSDSVTVNAALVEQVSQQGNIIESLTCELSDAQGKITALDEDNTLRTSHALDLQEQIHALKEQMQLLHADLQASSETRQSLEAVVEGLRQKDSETKKINQTLVCEKQRLLDESLLMERNKQDLEANLSHLTAERTHLLEEAVTHSEQLNDMKQRATSLESDYEAVQCESETLRDQLAKSVEEKRVLDDENKSFSKKLFEAEGRVQDLQLRLSSMLADKAILAEQLAERIESIHILEAALFDLQKDNTNLSKEVGLLQQQVFASRAREASLLVEMHDTSDVIQFLRAEVERLQQEVLEAEETKRRFVLEQKRSLEEFLLSKQKTENLETGLGLLAEEKVLFMMDIALHSGRANELECELSRLEAEKGLLQQKLLVARCVEDQLKEDLKNLLEETKQLSGILDLQKQQMEKQEETLQSLQLSLSYTKEEQQIIMDKMNLLKAEKGVLLQELKESQHEAGTARDNFLNVQTDLSQLHEVQGTTATELANKRDEVRDLQEKASILQSAKLEVEQKLELSSRHALAQEEEAKALREMLAVAQQENMRLESQSGDAQRRIIEVSEKCDRQGAGLQVLRQELAAVGAIKKKLEEELRKLQEEKTACDQKLEKMQQELLFLQEQKEQSELDLEAAILQGHQNEAKLSNLQEKLVSAESVQLELSEKHARLSEDWDAAERRLQEEIVQLKSAILQEQNDLKFQNSLVLNLEDEIRSLQAEKMALQDDTALNVNLMVELQQQIDGLNSQLLEKQEEVVKLSTQANCLQQSLLSTEQESADLKNHLQKHKDCHDAVEMALKDELCLSKSEVMLKGAQITELHDTLSGLEHKNEMLLEGMAMKDLELKKEVQLFVEENKELTQKLQDSDAELVQVKANLKLLEVELHQVQERLCNLQNENKSKEVLYQAQAEENALFKEQEKELTGALSKLQAETAMLKSKVADDSAAFSNMNHKLLGLTEEKAEALQKAGLHEAQVNRLQRLVMELQGDNEASKRQADLVAEEVNYLKTGNQTLESQISELNRQYQQKFDSSITQLDLLKQELAAAREENTKLREMVSDGAKSVEKLQEQRSSLYDSKQDLEGAVHHLKGQLKDSQIIINKSEKSRETLINELEGHTEKFLQMMSEIEGLDKMLSINQASEQASVRNGAFMAQDSLDKLKKPVFHLQETIPSLDEVLSTAREPFLSPERSPDNNGVQSESPSPREPIMIRETSVSRLETINSHQESLFNDRVGAIERVKERILTLLKEGRSSKDQSVAALAEPEALKSPVEELQEELSNLKQEIGHLTLEVNLYKKEASHLKKILEGEEVQEEGEVTTHAEVKALEALVYALKESLVGFEEKSRGLKEEIDTTQAEKGSLQFMLSDLQGKSLSHALLLRNNLLFLCKGIKALAEEWVENIGNKGRYQIVECIERLSKLENLCTSSASHENEKMWQNEGERRSLQPEETLHPSVANTFVLQQLQERVEEAILLRETVEDMLPCTHQQEQSKEEKEPVLNCITKESMPTDKHHSHENQHWSLSTDSIGNEFELDMEEADSIGDHTPDGSMREKNVVLERGSLDHGGEIELIEGLARLHINLGMRLHQALMDEKLENELQELKEGRKQVEEELQARVQQVQMMEAELEKLQMLLKKGSEEDRTFDSRQHQQWLRRKKRAEKRARKLSKELVLQRQQVANMRDVLLAWTEQQELATEILEEQVLSLVSKECAPTMEGWDADQVTQLMEEMQNRKALTRRHSMDLQSVGQELQRVGSSIQSTHLQLLKGEEQEQEQEHEVDQGKSGTSMNSAPGSINKLSRFGLTWLLLLFSTERKGLFKSRKSTSTGTPASPKKSQSVRASTSTAMSTFVAQTKKMGCCACGPSYDHHQKSLDDK